MAHENDSKQIEDIATIEQNANNALPPTSSEIYHGDSEIVVDIALKGIQSTGASDLRLAKDGHVCPNRGMFRCDALTAFRPS